MKKIVLALIALSSISAFGNVNDIGSGSIFELKQDIILKQDASMAYPGIRASGLSGAHATRSSYGGVVENSYTSMHCELHAKRSENPNNILLKKGLKLKVKQALSSRTDLDVFFEDSNEVMFNMIKRYQSKHGDYHLFANISFNHPAIEKLMCVVPNNENKEVPLWFLERSVGDYFDITVKSGAEIYQ